MPPQKPSSATEPTLERTRHPGIYRKGSRYVVVWRDRGRQKKKSCRTLAEARAFKGERDAGDTRAPSRERFETYARTWLDTYKGRTARGFSETTRVEYRRDIEQRAMPYFRAFALDDIRPQDVRAFFTKLERDGVTVAGIRKTRAPLRALFATAVEDGAMRSNPAAGVRVLGQADDAIPEKAKGLSDEELRNFLKAVPDEWRLFFEFLTHTGLRISETIALTWADIKFGDRARVQVRTQVYRGKRKRLKSKFARRDVPLSGGMATKLSAACRGHSDTEPVFATTAGTVLSPANVSSRVLKPAARAAGIGWVSYHTFRHTCASLLFAEGMNLKQVQRWLGHHKASFTLDTYIHLLNDDLVAPDFLDARVRATNRATAGPETAENRGSAEPLDPQPRAKNEG